MRDQVYILNEYLPKQASEIIASWIKKSNCEFTISKSRISKYGDYRPPYRDYGHRISVNGDLNPYAFLITTVHEFAHLKTWNEYKSTIMPHGREWKNNFKWLMDKFLDQNIFPAEIEEALRLYLRNPAASTSGDIRLFKVLKKYDSAVKRELNTIDSIPYFSVFSIKGGRIFRKEEKLRKRYRCLEVNTGKIYLFSPIAEVKLIEGSK